MENKSGARIEISIEEYNAMKDRITDLEKEVARSDRKIEELEVKLASAKDSLDYIIDGTSWVERAFQWKELVKAVKESTE